MGIVIDKMRLKEILSRKPDLGYNCRPQTIILIWLWTHVCI